MKTKEELRENAEKLHNDMQRIYKELPDDLIELSIIGESFAKKNKNHTFSKRFYKIINGKEIDLIEFKQTITFMILLYK